MIKELVPKVFPLDQQTRTNSSPNLPEAMLKDYLIINRMVLSGQAMLYLASKNGRLYVLKVYQQSTKSEKIYENQVEIMKKLEFRGIIPLEENLSNVEFETQYGLNTPTCCFISMPYFQNGDLLEWVLSKNPFTEKIARYFTIQLVSTFRYLLSKDIFHRDIKPQNILIGEDFKPILIDFGLSTNGKNINRGFVGSVRCAAPEIIKEKEYTSKSEIYSLGILLFFASTGHYPYSVARITDASYRLLFEKKYKQFWLNFESKSRITLSDSFKQLFISMVHHDPSKRPSLDEILEFEWLQKDVADFQQYTTYMRQQKYSMLSQI